MKTLSGNNPAKVLYVSHSAEHQGAVLSLYQLAKGLDRNVYIPCASFSKEGTIIESLKAIGVRSFILRKRGFLNHKLILEAYRLIKSEGINIVHLNNAVSFCKNVAIAARLAGVKVIWHIREDPDGKRVRRLDPWIRRLASRIIAVSTPIMRRFEGSGKCVMLYNGVDEGEFRADTDGSLFRDRFEIRKDAFVFGLVGTIEPRKGTMLFMRAAEEIAQAYADCSFMLVGSGLPEYERELAEFLAARPLLKERTVLTGRIINVPEAIAALDVLVLPSSWEGFPRVVIEAMSSGKPVISTPVGEVPGIIDDGINGFILGSLDKGTLVEAMKRCLEIRGGLEEIGKKARQKIVDNFTLRAHVMNMQNEYSKLKQHG